MKKTPLKRKSWLKRGGPLKRRSPAEDGKPAIYHRLIRKKPFPSKQSSGLSQLKQRKHIPQKSAKRKVEEKSYLALRGEFLLKNPFCGVCLEEWAQRGMRDRGVQPATEVHHKAGRGRFYLRVDTWMAVCHAHHEKITASRKWAEVFGYSLTVAQRRAVDAQK